MSKIEDELIAQLNEKYHDTYGVLKTYKDKISECGEKYYSAMYKFYDSFLEGHWYIYHFGEEVSDNTGFGMLIDEASTGIATIDKTFAEYYITRDGFCIKKSVFNFQNEDRQKTKKFADLLKEHINKEFNVPNSIQLTTFAYLVLRYGLIKYVRDKYLIEYGQSTLEDFCDANANEDNVGNWLKNYYTYYFIFENDITLPLVSTYNALSPIFDEQYEKSKNKRLDNDYFGDILPQVITATVTENRDKLPLIEQTDQMTGRQFEEFIADYFKKQGYKVVLTPASGDYGIDVIISDAFVKIGIQTKCYSGKISNDAIQEAVTGLKHYQLDKAMVITNSCFQPSAVRLADENNVILWDRDRLIKALEEH